MNTLWTNEATLAVRWEGLCHFSDDMRKWANHPERHDPRLTYITEYENIARKEHAKALEIFKSSEIFTDVFNNSSAYDPRFTAE